MLGILIGSLNLVKLENFESQEIELFVALRFDHILASTLYSWASFNLVFVHHDRYAINQLRNQSEQRLMCGSRFFRFSLHEDLPDQLQDVSNSLKHRGPDSGGYWFENDNIVGLAHRRLSILDLSDAGAQPMVSHCGRYVIFTIVRFTIF